MPQPYSTSVLCPPEDRLYLPGSTDLIKQVLHELLTLSSCESSNAGEALLGVSFTAASLERFTASSVLVWNVNLTPKR